MEECYRPFVARRWISCPLSLCLVSMICLLFVLVLVRWFISTFVYFFFFLFFRPRVMLKRFVTCRISFRSVQFFSFQFSPSVSRLEVLCLQSISDFVNNMQIQYVKPLSFMCCNSSFPFRSFTWLSIYSLRFILRIILRSTKCLQLLFEVPNAMMSCSDVHYKPYNVFFLMHTLFPPLNNFTCACINYFTCHASANPLKHLLTQVLNLELE